jgi:two-component system, NtrC family, response regulator HydG
MSEDQPTGFDDVQTLLSRRVRRTSTDRGAFEIRVVSGPDTGHVVTISPANPSPLLVGQSPSCELRLSDRQVSRRHLSIEMAQEQLRVNDMDSTNGTRINGVVVGEAFLQGGERIELGGTLLLVQRLTPGTTTTVQLPTATSFGKVVGASEAMRRLYPLCERLAQSSVPVIIEGETGTG